MRIGLLTDIHGDFATMQRVVDFLERRGVDRLVCLGDLVVHGPEPNAVVDFFRARPEIPVVAGNHDIGATASSLDGLHFFSADSRANTEATRRALTEANRAYLAGLPLQVEDAHAAYTHAAIGDPFAFLRHPETLADSFSRMPRPLLFTGHAHRTRIHHWPAGRGQWCSSSPVEAREWVHPLVPEDRYIIHVGCTAQLKYDLLPPICAVFEPEERLLRLHELPDLR